MDGAPAVWISPDCRIKKTVLTEGRWGPTPGENSECRIEITGTSEACGDVSRYNDGTVVVGEGSSIFGRSLDRCLMTMRVEETADVAFYARDGAVYAFRLRLAECRHDGRVWEWDAKKKYELAARHKSGGNELFKTRHVDASHRFAKALKIISSIPIDVQDPPEEIDGVRLADIRALKATLFNNLASCHLRHGNYGRVVALCERVLAIDGANPKALYKLGVARYEERDYERSVDALKKLAELEPGNRAAAEKLKEARLKLTEANARVDDMFRKMFPGV